MERPQISDLAKRQIRAAAKHTLQQAGVAGVVPTPLEQVSRAAGIAETIDISQLPTDLVARRPHVLKRVLGAVFYREQVVFVDRSQGHARGRFIEAHEISHRIIPAHEAFYRLDDEHRIFGPTKKRIDLEADIGAAELLFQGDLFVRMALDYEVTIAAPIALAPTFQVSLTAAVRHYAVYHPDAVCVVFAGVYRRSDGTVPVWGVHESPSFASRFGSGAAVFSRGVPAMGDSGSFGATVEQAVRFGDIATGEVRLPDVAGQQTEFVVEAFFNRRAVLLMLTEARAARALGRRISLRTG